MTRDLLSLSRTQSARDREGRNRPRQEQEPRDIHSHIVVGWMQMHFAIHPRYVKGTTEEEEE